MTTQLLRQAAQKTGLNVIKIETKDELLTLLEGGLNTLYAEVFGGEPYNEVFTEDEVTAIFCEYFDKGGHVFVGLCPETSAPVSFIISTPLSAKFDVATALECEDRVDTMAYVAEDGVAEPFRRRGISTAFKQLLLNDCAENGFEDVILRTSVTNVPQRRAVEKAGGVAVEGVTQILERQQRDGVVTEENCFYNFKLACA